MSKLQTSQIRTAFLEFFEALGHRRVTSSSLVPRNDPTLLFTNAGMVQFKDVFTGRETRPYTRATTAQKVVRAGGKHNDLDNVGHTARHHTFFEMMGNFSFGDYFKEDAIKFAWELVTGILEVPKDRLAVTIFKGEDGVPRDLEARQIWERVSHLSSDRILELGKKDNFWSMGDTGPCGPCSEIHFFQGNDFPCKEPVCLGVACDCDRWLEIWNLVFMQFERSADGKYAPLPKPSIDTGAGLERLAAVSQGVRSNYDTDLLRGLVAAGEKLSGRRYGAGNAEDDVALRVIADHARATTFLVGDGVLPSNEGRGYVLRRIMRRAIRYGTRLGLEKPFLHEVCRAVVSSMSDAYPDLRENQAFVLEVAQREEESFRRTLEKGLTRIQDAITTRESAGQSAKVLPGEVVFKLYDTYGFPKDLTEIVAKERGFTIDDAGTVLPALTVTARRVNATLTQIDAFVPETGQVLDAGLLHGDCMTVTGKTMAENLADLDPRHIAGILADPHPHRRVDRQQQRFQQHLAGLGRAHRHRILGKIVRAGQTNRAAPQRQAVIGITHAASPGWPPARHGTTIYAAPRSVTNSAPLTLR